MNKHVTIIPSKGRADYFLKYKDLPILRFQDKIFNTKLWISEKEKEDYQNTLDILGINSVELVIDKRSTNISETRQEILNYCKEQKYDYLFMPDDDVEIFSRSLNFKRIPMDLIFNTDLFNHLCSICSKEYPLVSIRDRFMINNCKTVYEKNHNIHLLYFIYIPIFIKEKISFIYENIKHFKFPYEDRIIQLLLYQIGYKSCTSSMYAMSQRHGNNSIGGCSSYRTIEEANIVANIIHKDFPNYTDVFIKNNWSKGSRKELKFYFKRYLNPNELKYIPKEEMEKFKNRGNVYGI